MQRSASAEWSGPLRGGRGRITTASGVLTEAPYNYGKRFGEELGTNPEELIAAAHSSCFTMALSSELEKLGFSRPLLHADAQVQLEFEHNAWTVTHVHLTVLGQVPGATASQFEEAATRAKRNCPISRLLHTQITLETHLQEAEAIAMQGRSGDEPMKPSRPFEPVQT